MSINHDIVLFAVNLKARTTTMKKFIVFTFAMAITLSLFTACESSIGKNNNNGGDDSGADGIEEALDTPWATAAAQVISHSTNSKTGATRRSTVVTGVFIAQNLYRC